MLKRINVNFTLTFKIIFKACLFIVELLPSCLHCMPLSARFTFLEYPLTMPPFLHSLQPHLVQVTMATHLVLMIMRLQACHSFTYVIMLSIGIFHKICIREALNTSQIHNIVIGDDLAAVGGIAPIIIMPQFSFP